MRADGSIRYWRQDSRQVTSGGYECSGDYDSASSTHGEAVSDSAGGA